MEIAVAKVNPYLVIGKVRHEMTEKNQQLPTRAAKQDTVDRILDVAENMARKGGYNGFSFREIATEIGIKSASVHYHFPNKEVLGAALAERYTKRFLSTLGAPETGQALSRYVQVFDNALKLDGMMCLCGVLGSEVDSLPAQVVAQTRAFFERNMDWLEKAFSAEGHKDPKGQAAHVLATLEGALILARNLDNPAYFDLAVQKLRA